MRLTEFPLWRGQVQLHHFLTGTSPCVRHGDADLVGGWRIGYRRVGQREGRVGQAEAKGVVHVLLLIGQGLEIAVADVDVFRVVDRVVALVERRGARVGRVTVGQRVGEFARRRDLTRQQIGNSTAALTAPCAASSTA